MSHKYGSKCGWGKKTMYLLLFGKEREFTKCLILSVGLGKNRLAEDRPRASLVDNLVIFFRVESKET